MKSPIVFSIISSFCLASAAVASESHDFDKGMESSLRSAIHDRHVHIHVHRGVVGLDGHVQTEADRARIEALVRQTPGVVAVKDDLHVTLPSPAASGSVPVSIPIYASPPPVVVPSTTVVTSPAPLLLQEYPRLSIQPWSMDDQSTAVRIARRLQLNARPITIIDNVTITPQGGAVSLKGAVETAADHDALLTAVEQAGGVTAIYDQLRVRSM